MSQSIWRRRLWSAASLCASGAVMALGTGAAPALADSAGDAGLAPVIVTARLRPEDAQSVPTALSVLTEETLRTTGIYNISQVSQLVPSLFYNSPNPRNTAFTIRGLGSSVVAVSQANDGLEPGVGFYVDQVYHARPATAAFDMLDVERVEVLRGPQGTVFGKNTTAGAINITTKAPSFTPEIEAEGSLGELDYRQVKLSATGPILGDLLAARIAVVSTEQDGNIQNVRTGGRDNNINNRSVHAQLLYKPSATFSLRLSADYNVFDSACCTQVYVGVAPTLKPAAKQYPALAAELGYAPPSLDPYQRLTDIDAPVGANTNEGGLSAIADWNLGKATVTSVTAWRFWNWDAANDRDYTGLSIQTLQHIPSRQDQYSQELRIASNGHETIEYVAGLYYFNQGITGRPITQYGPQATYWLLGPAPTYPANLLDGYGTDGRTRFHTNSYAAFGEATWHVTSRLGLTTGLRYTGEDKEGSYASYVYGGLTGVSTSLLNAKLSILRPQAYEAKKSSGNLSGRFVASYDVTDGVMAYASYADTSKSGGLNMSGLPLNAANLPALATVVIRPEKNTTYELGLKSKLLGNRVIVNADTYVTTVKDFQTNVVDTGPGALRGYLANIPKVQVKGAELDGQVIVTDSLSAHLSAAWTDGTYISYANGPCPLELIASSTTVCNLSGKPLSSLPRWVWSAGGEFHRPVTLGNLSGEGYAHLESTLRTRSFGDPSDSAYTVIGGYGLTNVSVGFRAPKGWEASVWVRNAFDAHYLQNVTIQAGNSGLIVGTPGDARSVGATVRMRF